MYLLRMGTLELEYEYDGSYLASNGAERNPTLIWWSSAAPHGWYTKVPVTLGKDSRSGKQKLTIPLESNTFAADEMIGVCVLTETENHTKRWCNIKSGTTKFYLQNLFADNGKGENPLIMPTVVDDRGTPLVKGSMKVNITKKPTASWFRPIDRFTLTQANDSFLLPLIEGMAVKMMAPLDAGLASQVGLKAHIPASDASCEGMHAPFLVNEGGRVMGDLFWVNQTPDVEPDEPFMVNLMECNLKRHRLTRAQVEGAIDEQFKRTDDKLNDDFHRVCLFTINMVCTLSTMMPYVGDYTHLEARGVRGSQGDSNNPHKRLSIEYFNDMLMDLAGDCEDSARLNHQMWTRLKFGRKSLKDDNTHHMRHGSWQDPTLRALQMVTYLYCGMGSLGTVTARFLGEKEGKEQLPEIGSPEDEAETGGHMWWEAVSVQRVEKMLSATRPKSKPFRLYPHVEHRPWESKLEQLVGEGTGQLHPEVKPRTVYNYQDKEGALREHKQSIAALRLAALQPTLKELRTTRVQTVLEDRKNMRLSTFYRETTHVGTDEFLREHINLTGATMVYNRPGKPWAYGVALRHKLFNEPEVAMVPHPKLTPDEIRYSKAVFRQSMPMSQPVFDAKAKQKIESSYAPLIQEFTKGLKLKAGTPNFHYNFYIEGPTEDFKKKDFRARLAKDLSNVKHLVSVTIEPEVLTSEVYDLRVELGFNMSDKDVEQILAMKMPRRAERYIGALSKEDFIGLRMVAEPERDEPVSLTEPPDWGIEEEEDEEEDDEEMPIHQLTDEEDDDDEEYKQQDTFDDYESALAAASVLYANGIYAIVAWQYSTGESTVYQLYNFPDEDTMHSMAHALEANPTSNIFAAIEVEKHPGAKPYVLFMYPPRWSRKIGCADPGRYVEIYERQIKEARVKYGAQPFCILEWNQQLPERRKFLKEYLFASVKSMDEFLKTINALGSSPGEHDLLHLAPKGGDERAIDELSFYRYATPMLIYRSNGGLKPVSAPLIGFPEDNKEDAIRYGKEHARKENWCVVEWRDPKDDYRTYTMYEFMDHGSFLGFLDMINGKGNNGTKGARKAESEMEAYSWGDPRIVYVCDQGLCSDD